jgi:hypothetical protein
MALNLNPVLVDEQSMRRNLRAIERHVNNDHYVRSISPGAMVLEATAAHAVVGSRWGVLSLPDAASTSGLFTFERPSEWVTGKVKMTIRYSSPVGSTANFRVVAQVGVAKEGSAMATTTLVMNDMSLVPGPAVADTRISYSVYSTANVTQEFDCVEVRVQRTGAHADDGNVNALHVYAIRLEFIPAMQEADVR